MELVGHYRRVTGELLPARTFEARRAALTAAELATLPPSTRLYRSVGKAYFQTPQAAIQQSLQAIQEGAAEQIAQLTDTKGRLETALQDLEQVQLGLKARLEASA